MDDFPLPADFIAANTPKPKAAARKVIPFPKTGTPQQTIPRPDRAAIDAFWNSLPATEQQRIEEELVSTAPRFLREQYLEGREERGLLFQTVRQAMIDEYVRGVLQQKAG